MKTESTFKEKLAESTDASYLVMEYLTSVGKYVEDLSNDSIAQQCGYDFRVDDEPCEFKTDKRTHYTENIAFEIVANVGLAKVGGLLRSEAKWLLYYELETGVCHKILLSALIKALQERGINRRWQTVIINTPIGKNQFGYYTMSLLIPLDFIRNTLDRSEYQKFTVPKKELSNGNQPDISNIEPS